MVGSFAKRYLHGLRLEVLMRTDVDGLLGAPLDYVEDAIQDLARLAGSDEVEPGPNPHVLWLRGAPLDLVECRHEQLVLFRLHLGEVLTAVYAHPGMVAHAQIVVDALAVVGVVLQELRRQLLVAVDP